MDNFTISVSAKEIYDSLNEIKSLQREMIEHQKKTNGRVTKAEGELEVQSKRILKLEKIHIKQVGIISGVVAVVTLIANYLF